MNNKEDIDEILDEYKSSFDIIQFNMIIDKCQDAQYGDCDRFVITRK